MSEGKWLIFDGIIIDALDEITNKLESDIKKEKENPPSEYGYYKDYPLECLLSQLNDMKVQHKRSYIRTSMCFYEDAQECENVIEYTKKHIPEWDGIFDETDVESDKRRKREINKSREEQGLPSLFL